MKATILGFLAANLMIFSVAFAGEETLERRILSKTLSTHAASVEKPAKHATKAVKKENANYAGKEHSENKKIRATAIPHSGRSLASKRKAPAPTFKKPVRADHNHH